MTVLMVFNLVQTIEISVEFVPEYGQSINPISRLIQIQQAKKEKEPIYTLIAEKGMPRRREFVMQVILLLTSFVLPSPVFLFEYGAEDTNPNKKN